MAQPRMRAVSVVVFGLAWAVAACGGGEVAAPPPSTPTSTQVPPPVASPEGSPAGAEIVAATDRDDADRKLDAGRHPAEMLEFFGVKPGWRVAEIAAGTGYTAELLARAVGEAGAVYGQNNPWLREKFAAKPWAARLAKPVNHKIVDVNREFDDPLPEVAKNLDAVFCILFYHDLFWMNVDRGKMNAAIFRALKPGGVYAIVDHSGRAGTGSTEVKTLHRIEESVVRSEIEQAGFKLAAEGAFLRNPDDARDWNAAPNAAGERRGTSDRFVLKFVKP